MMTIDELLIEANYFLKEFSLNLEIPLVINNRLKTTMGVFVHSKKSKIPLRIELSKNLLKYGHGDVIIDTLRHECLHYALYILNKPFRDNDEYFILEANRLSVGLTEECNVGVEYELECTECGGKAITDIKKHLDKSLIGSRYKLQCCKSGYLHTKTIINDGITEIYI